MTTSSEIKIKNIGTKCGKAEVMMNGDMVNEVPSEVPRPKAEGLQAQRVLAKELLEGLYSPSFTQIFILLSSWTRKDGFLAWPPNSVEYHTQFYLAELQQS